MSPIKAFNPLDEEEGCLTDGAVSGASEIPSLQLARKAHWY